MKTLKHNNTFSLRYFEEPSLDFGYGQKNDDPKKGLYLFGPLDNEANPVELRIGVVGTRTGLKAYEEWVNRIRHFVPPERNDAAHHIGFPGFKEVFRADWPSKPVARLELSGVNLRSKIRNTNRHRAVHDAVGIYVDRIIEYVRKESENINFWFVVIPDEIYKYGRPLSKVPSEIALKSSGEMSKKLGKKILTTQPSLFDEYNEVAKIYLYEANFHNQLKARLLEHRIVAQIVRETTISPSAAADFGRRLQDDATVAWNLCTTSFYKADGRPWRLSHVRKGVCYVGIVFKKKEVSETGANACCGAQLFLDSGDGLVFKGAEGQWLSEGLNKFNLDEDAAGKLMASIVEYYKEKTGEYPTELFIHGRTRFSEEEWKGFTESAPQGTKIVGVRITSSSELKLFRPAKMPVLRGSAFIANPKRGYLWTRGYVPALRTYAGREVPNPLLIEIVRSNSDIAIETVMEDVMGLCKVNFNACIYADGLPVTLRFADDIGEILTSAPVPEYVPLPFKHYI